MRFGFNEFFPATRDRLPLFFGDSVRFPIPWDIGHLPWVDSIAQGLAVHGQQSILSPTTSGSGAMPTLVQFVGLIGNLASRFKSNPNACALMLWNEPNHHQNGPLAPQTYARWARDGYDAAKRQGWTKPILIAGPSPVRDWEGYLKSVFRAGVPDDADLAIHPYPRQGVDELESVSTQIATCRRVLKNRSGHGRLHVTEVGISTADHTPEQQAYLLPKIVKLCRDKRVLSCLIFKLSDNASQPPKLGVMHEDFSPKPAYQALKTMASD